MGIWECSLDKSLFFYFSRVVAVRKFVWMFFFFENWTLTGVGCVRVSGGLSGFFSVGMQKIRRWRVHVVREGRVEGVGGLFRYFFGFVCISGLFFQDFLECFIESGIKLLWPSTIDVCERQRGIVLNFFGFVPLWGCFSAHASTSTRCARLPLRGRTPK